MGAAVMNRRVFAPDEARTIALVAIVPLVFALVATFFPRLVAWPLAVILLWISTSLFIRASHLRKKGKKQGH
jgi:cardiolipin synthase